MNLTCHSYLNVESRETNATVPLSKLLDVEYKQLRCKTPAIYSKKMFTGLGSRIFCQNTLNVNSDFYFQHVLSLKIIE